MKLGDLSGKKGLVLGIANEHSIAYGCAKVASELGAELAITYQNEKARPYVEPLANELNAPHFLACDVTDEAEVNAVFEAITEDWGRLDFVIHSIAFAPKEALHSTVTHSPKDGFLQAMDISCHSFARIAAKAEPLMTEGGCLLTMSYYGSQHVVEEYSVMGPVKAALESTSKYMAVELGDKNIRVNIISPGPMQTRAASGIKEFDKLLNEAKERSATHRLVSNEEVGKLAAFLVSDDAAAITGEVHYIDAGYHIS